MFRFLNLALGGLSNGMIYAAVALSLVMIWRSTRIVNFAQGGMLMFTTFIAWDLSQVHRVNYWVALVVAMVSGLILGGVAERVLVRPVENGPPLNAVIVTLGLLITLQALAGMIEGQRTDGGPADAIILARFDRLHWMTTEKDIWFIAEYLCEIPHRSLLKRGLEKHLTRIDARTMKGEMVGHRKK